MSVADIIILITIIIILLSIIFFTQVYPRLKGRHGACVNCPIGKEKKIKRALKAYRKKHR